MAIQTYLRCSPGDTDSNIWGITSSVNQGYVDNRQTDFATMWIRHIPIRPAEVDEVV